MEQQVGPFLDKIKNLAREPEWPRLQPNQCTRLYISNILARTKEDNISKLKQLGVNIRQDDRAKFEVKYSKKLRLETAALSVLVEPNSQLLDLLTGTQRVDGIMGPASFTIIEDDTENMHQAELKPHGQIDRQLLPSLTNIWSALGASEAQFLSWVLLCSSSYLHKTCLPESVILSSPDDPTHLPTIWGGPRQKWHRGHILLQSAQPLVQAHSKDTLETVMSVVGVKSLHRTAPGEYNNTSTETT